MRKTIGFSSFSVSPSPGIGNYGGFHHVLHAPRFACSCEVANAYFASAFLVGGRALYISLTIPVLAPKVVRPIWPAAPAMSVGGFTLTFGFGFFAQLSSLTMRCSISRTLVRYSSSLDGWAWLPNEKILLTGDACVNGPYNYTGDGNIGDWIKTLEAVKELGAKTVCPGHGPVGGAELLDDQHAYFTTLTDEVKKLTGKDPSEVKQSVEGIRETLKKQERIARYVGNFFPAQVEKVFVELGGKPFLPKTASVDDHADHGVAQCTAPQFRPSSVIRTNAAPVRAGK